MMDWLVGPFADYAFMRRALVGCLAIASGATPVGVFLVLRRLSLAGDALSHAVLPGVAVGFLVAGLSSGVMIFGGLVAGLTVAMLAGYITRSTHLHEDASLAAFYLLSLAAGVLIISTSGSGVDLLHVLFGSVLALDAPTLIAVGITSSVTLLVMALLYRPLVLECLDPDFLRSLRGASPLAHYGFLALVVINLVAGFHALGTLMVVGIMILPAAAARFWSSSLPGQLAVAFATAAVASYAGLLTSFHWDLPSGPAIILAAGVIYAVSLVAGRFGSLLPRRKHLEA